ncbi:ZZ-type zinc finger-containing protein 3-like isoform X2 [Mercenaria mercenaria]|uniref:ZZ-type zinc finger-containing protein 3-like isoform X2 n=1 Tax=Mercenaria mercenaria TaxID=6596 RepID=UPI00234F0E97|nr:ZZ-type zinc finger-containing protein 3-like isoform X2 [Mercenaria mercenaria]
MSSEENTNQSFPGTSQSDDMLQSIDQSGLTLFNSKDEDSDTGEEESETYYFESDHTALKGNHDYQMMLRAIATLEAQRIQAVKDLDKLYECQKEALTDPIQFVDKLQRGQDLKFPKPQNIVELPQISWEKYTSNLDFSSFGTHRHMTRLKKQLKEGNNISSLEDQKSSVKTESEGVIRGRVKTEKKSETFNLLWTPEEQKRLEELLIEYPPEEVEAKRFQKIATALGNRTPIQVQSRVQKYFIKLANAGLPIPGRLPNMGLYKKKNQKGQRYQKMYNPSTFFTSIIPPVYMSDDDNSQSYEGSVVSNTETFDYKEENVSDDESIPVELRSTPEYQELINLKRLRKEKLGYKATPTEHVGFKCDRCDIEPIVGTRWHCTDCPPDIAVDFCEQCVDCGYETKTHNSSHRLKPKRATDSSTYMDSDYIGFIPGGACTGYNYLDPNYMPAS